MHTYIEVHISHLLSLSTLGSPFPILVIFLDFSMADSNVIMKGDVIFPEAQHVYTLSILLSFLFCISWALSTKEPTLIFLNLPFALESKDSSI